MSIGGGGILGEGVQVTMRSLNSGFHKYWLQYYSSIDRLKTIDKNEIMKKIV